MPLSFEPHTAILPPAQREIWPQLAPAASLSFVLYGGTAIALHLSQTRQSFANVSKFDNEPQMIERQFGKTVYPREFGTALLRTVIERKDLTLDEDRLLCGGGQSAATGKKS